MDETGFYIGKQGTLYFRRPNGSLSRFGVRVRDGGLVVWDPLLRRWYSLPARVPDRAGGGVSIEVSRSE